MWLDSTRHQPLMGGSEVCLTWEISCARLLETFSRSPDDLHAALQHRLDSLLNDICVSKGVTPYRWVLTTSL